MYILIVFYILFFLSFQYFLSNTLTVFTIPNVLMRNIFRIIKCINKGKKTDMVLANVVV
uniref:Uncharacterized protein n=1 Tax=Octopus bimaculoides TaxID=37653 RepID=A0A0L8FIJ9_OCTBM